MDPLSHRKIYTVGEITSEIKQSLDQFGIVWIQGEISNCKHHSSGHLYFSLKDAHAQMKAACFRNNNRYLKFRPEDGMEVLVRGRLSVYEPRGDYQVIVEYMEPVGVGSLQLAFEQLKDRLRKEGLFEEAHKKPLPLLPRKIGIVTSPTGAAIRDMLRILKRRNASLGVLIYPAKVQGTGAAEEITSGIRYLNSRDDIDVVIIGRGGGSIEDLWAFNEEVVARAVYGSELPLISAVGHEVDFTISDFVADLRAPTPSAAAEMVSGAREDLRISVRSLHGRLRQAIRSGIERRRLHLERLARNRAFAVAPNRIRDLQQRFDEASLRLVQSLKHFVSDTRHRERMASAGLNKVDLRRFIVHKKDAWIQCRHGLTAGIQSCMRRERARFELAVGKLDSLSPLAILKRGFSLCRDENGRIIKSAADVSRGDSVDVILSEGGLNCLVRETRKPR
ncbi:MAG: exodeoxyribonuclease VII large subunit [Acidobacteria bacterium]|nr:exodeoxyribonuclease VII large subunit [Acidobacteriota bacterium]